MNRAARSLVAGALALLTHVSGADAQSSAIDDTRRADAADILARCATLVPTPDLRDVRGRLDLVRPPTPFGVAVTADGSPQYALETNIEGLPRPESLGPYTTYMAWATTLNLETTIRLGEVTNGRRRLGTIALAQFRVLISAEASTAVKTRTGRLILRATSPAARLLAHRDRTPLSSSGPTAGPGVAGGPTDAPLPPVHDHQVPAADAERRWTMPPMSGLPMMPGMHGMTPNVAPFVPGAGIDPATIPFARPREVRRLASGETLDLSAGLVRRRIRNKAFVAYGFNGQHPGPLIEVAQHATITVRFTNRLDMPSTIHWHGVRLDNRSDGTPGVTQPAVLPGDTFTYRVYFPDPGIYWYHPHVREDIQQDLGLAGNVLVEAPGRDYFAPANREEVLLLDDFLIDDAGPVPYGASAPTHALTGRFGNVFMVNGEPDAHLTVRRGEVVRFFLTNASNARMYNLSFAAPA